MALRVGSALALALLAALPDLPAEPSAPVAAPARLRVLAGHALLAEGERVQRLGPERVARAIDGPAALEFGPSARVELSWPGLASLRFEGPAALEWEPPAGPRAPLRVRCLRLGGVDLEARRGALAVELPAPWSGWELEVRRAVVSLRALPGAVEARHLGGEPVPLRSLVERPDPAPERLEPGRTLRLAPPPRPDAGPAGEGRAGIVNRL